MSRLAVMLCALGPVVACTTSSTDDPLPPEIPDAVQRAFDETCAEAQCHDPDARAGGLSLAEPDSLAIIEGPSSQNDDLPLVHLGSLGGSYMAVKLLPQSQLPEGTVRNGEPMPLGGYEGNDVDNVNTILSWIAGHGPSGGGDDSAATEGSGSGEGSGGATDDGSTGGDTGGDTGPSNSDGGPSFPRCSVEGVTAGEVSSPLDKGDEAGKFPVVVAEALAHGLPVITTRGAPWADLDTYDCGWWIDVGVEPLVNALRSAIALSDEQLREMGARGREYVRRYDWEDIARRTTEVYWWILGQGRRPDCVRLD